jgi:hypothetical protein
MQGCIGMTEMNVEVYGSANQTEKANLVDSKHPNVHPMASNTKKTNKKNNNTISGIGSLCITFKRSLSTVLMKY